MSATTNDIITPRMGAGGIDVTTDVTTSKFLYQFRCIKKKCRFKTEKSEFNGNLHFDCHDHFRETGHDDFEETRTYHVKYGL